MLRGGHTVEQLATAFEVIRSLAHGHVAAVLGTLQKIELDKVLGQRASFQRNLAIAMVVSRLIEPASKLSTARNLDLQTGINIVRL